MTFATVWGRRLRWLFVWGTAILLTLNPSAAETPHAPALNAAHQQQAAAPVLGVIAFLEDPQKTLRIDDMQRPDVAVKFKAFSAPSSAINFGFTPSAYWLRFKISNTSALPLERMLEIAYARLSHIDFYASRPSGDFEATLTGMARPFATRPYPNRFFVFPLTVPAHSEQTIYLRVDSLNALQIPIKLWDVEDFHSYQLNDYIQQAWYYGMASVMIMFHLLLYFTLREKKSILYIIFLTTTALGLAAINGLSQEFIWTDAAFFNEFSSGFFSIYAVATLLLFTRQMLNTAKKTPRMDVMLKVCIVVLFALPIGLPFYYQNFIVISVVTLLVALLLMFYTGIYLAFKRHRSAYFFVTSFALFLLGGALTGLRVIGIIPSNAFTINALQWGSALEMLLLSFALADNFNQMRRDKEHARRHALEVQQKLVRTLQTTEFALEQTVKERTADLSQNNQELTQANTQLNAAYVAADHSRLQAQAAESEATRTMQALQSTQAHLIQSEKMASLGGLISGVAHEINTPIRSIQAHGVAISTGVNAAILDLPQIATEQHTAPIAAHAAAISLAVDRVSTVVNALKAFTRSDHSQAFTEAHLHESLDTVLTIFQHQLNKGVQVVRHFAPLPAIRCLHGELNQVWAHLIQNALQARHFKGTLTVTLRQEQQVAIVSISDTGDDAAKGNLGGVGMDIARQIIEKHHGSIKIESSASAGSTFSVHLPMVLT